MKPFLSATVISPTLIGREAQLTLLGGMLAQAGGGLGRGALISGEAGVGKSRLVAEVVAIAAEAGACVVRGHCFEHDRSLPYAPLLDALRTFCAGRSAHELGHAFATTAAELIKLFPELSALLPHVTPTPKLDPEQEKRRLFQALTRFLHSLTQARQPLLLVLEDLHWCDDTSLEWLLYLARELPAQPMFVMLTYRSDEIHPTLNRLLATLDRMASIDEVALPRLSHADVEAMLRAIFSLTAAPRADFLDALYELTDGNPFFIEEVLKALIAVGGIYQEGGEWTRKPLRELHIPRTVQVAVQQRTHRLHDAARQLLTLAAVAGQRFDFAVLQAITQETESQLLQHIKELVAAQLVVEESAETFAFRHALTRQAIYSGLLARERKALHRQVAEALERCYAGARDSHVGELAYHCYEAGLWAKATEWALRAADKAVGLDAHDEALSHYTRARASAEQVGQAEQVATIDQAIGAVYYTRGQYPQALESYMRALDSTTDAARRTMLQIEIGVVYVTMADQRGLAYLHNALDALDPATEARDAARAMLWLGRYYYFCAQYSQALTYLERAQQLFEPLGDTAMLRYAYHYLAAAQMLSAQFEQSMAWAWRCVALGEDPQLLSAAANGYWYLAYTSFYLGRWNDLDEYTGHEERIVQTLTRQLGVRFREEWIWILRSDAAYYQGDLESGVRLAHESVTLAAELHQHRAVIWANRMIVLLETARGAEELAYALGEQSVRAADELIEVTIQCRCRIALAELHLQRGQTGRAVELYEQCAALLSGSEIRVMQMELGSPMAEAYCAQGRLDAAAQIIAATCALAEETGARHYEALAWRVRGQIEAALGQDAQAAGAFERAIALCEAIGNRLELARTLYQRGALYRTRNDLEAARADWEQACALCGQMGARGLQWPIHAALGQLALARQRPVEAQREFAAARAIVERLAAGMHEAAFRENLQDRAAALIPAEPLVMSRRALKIEFEGLTERERMVAALIAKGHSNRMIAEQLVVSERTITTHVSNIFAKLGFTSRSQVARWADERKVVEPPPE
jgi:ATP/maltotriose-dependent transcriptional regulator MalT